jgi:hypothetical protein
MLLLGLPACAAVTPAAQSQQDIPPTLTATVTPSHTPSPQPTETPAPTLLPTETPVPRLSVCSPLQGFTLEELPDILSNPYNPPRREMTARIMALTLVIIVMVIALECWDCPSTPFWKERWSW